MKAVAIFSLCRLFLAGSAPLLLTAGAGCAHAAFVLTLTQSGQDILVSGSGSLNTTVLTALPSTSNSGATLQPSTASLFVGPGNSVYQGYTGLSGPAGLGSGTTTFYGSSTATGLVGVVRLNTTLRLATPAGYASGTPFSEACPFANATFSSVGINQGGYIYTWGTGANADSLTINVGTVPEPSTRAAATAGAGLLGVVAARRRCVRLS